MGILLERIAEVNAQGRAATAAEVSRSAKEAGMDPRGTAGYYAAALLVLKNDGRWLTEAGRSASKSSSRARPEQPDPTVESKGRPAGRPFRVWQSPAPT